jgi:thiosulfate reductase cytochrome b subunit
MSEIAAGPEGMRSAPELAPSSDLTKIVYRHTLWVRSWHWINAIALLLLLMSGLQIFDAHPTLNWGQASNFQSTGLLDISAQNTPHGPRGVTTVFGHAFDTTGVLGVSKGAIGQPQFTGFPAWATVPSYRDLATGRRWHFFFAWIFVVNGALFIAYTIWSRHLKTDLWPSVADLKTIPASIWEHVRLKHPQGEAAARYNVLQKFAYLIVLYTLLPLMLLTGLTMSPGMDAAFPILPWVFGGRQAARTIHFLSATGLVLFFLIHIFEVIVSGPLNEMRSIITGRFAIKTHAPAVSSGEGAGE